MSAGEVLARQTTFLGVLLVVSGLAAIAGRRHLVVNLLGAYLCLGGAVLLLIRHTSPQGAWIAVVILLAGALIAPLALTAFARWRAASGAADQSALRDPLRDSFGG